jgi:hypothetical protein
VTHRDLDVVPFAGVGRHFLSEGNVETKRRWWSSIAPDEHTTGGGNRPHRRFVSTPSQVSKEGSFVKPKYIIAVVILGAVLLLGAAPASAAAATPGPALSNVIDNLRNWVVGLLAALATLFLTIGGVRYMLAGGDPGQVERAKSALRSAAVGYALAALAPVLVTILQSVVGG